MDAEAKWRIALVIVVLATPILFVLWWGRRSNLKKEAARRAELDALARQLGGVVVGSEAATAWSAELLPPHKGDTGGLVNRLRTVRRPRFEVALDFQRGPWSVRVTEASIRRSISNGTRTFFEQRIEVRTAPLPSMKVSRIWRTDFRGKPLPPDHILAQGGTPVRQPPLTVARQGEQWQQVWLPSPANTEYVAFTSDPAGAARVWTPEAAEWLAEQASRLPLLIIFEAGLCYAVPVEHHINPTTLVSSVDAVLGLLERMTGSVPRPRDRV